ncbi:addiction module toxin RelE [Botrimarina mediterranea]|uniref:Rho termination factor N-terminal domain-containing protein n=1 Tax=Botrimarina mediterranea TaxID=2528022 RepID=A0A518KAY9_9BACT|nr:addiction module toxin RelE [Botrimarina mediterranea]QDV74955.1 hypothetical protein Spa11_31640 [Botrimarina mediterranea]QDV79600.1 hypothetical protein K2D_32150 [Planctomycetes bacterium K2D]
MPTAWTDREERQYEHIRDSALDRGRTTERAEEIAARTVNKQRRLHGKTANKTTQGTGSPHAKLEERTRQELYNRAKQLHIVGRSRLSKVELIDAIRARS